ncbi:MAG TPA: LPS export ABC transporter permease LptG [Methylophilaceae bacterium]|nr:LPS export ABC transporter permease LptG [Methylophilaceae bacterium]HQC27783.1 LPS export ABC transporter permease LptG [Methylotenera sp.]
MKIIHHYLLKEIVGNILLVMLALIAMFSFFDLIQELDALGKGNYGLAQVLLFVLLSAPGHVYEVIPVAVLVGTMLTLGLLSRYSELIILRVSGLSIFNIAVMLLKISLVFTLITFLIGEMITPISEKMAQRMRIKATDSVVAQEFRSGLWVKDGNTFINAEEVLPDTSLLNLHIYEFDDQAKLVRTRNAKRAEYSHGKWLLSDVSETNFSASAVEVRQFSEVNWQSLIRPELLNVLLIMPEKMSALNLYSYIRHLSVNKQKTTRYEVALWAKMIYPLACIVMVLLALPFGFVQQRASGASNKIFLGIMLGVTYQVLNRVSAHLGLLNDWPPLFSAIMPTVLFLIAGLTMLYFVERR